jgi:hypothetical protein
MQMREQQFEPPFGHGFPSSMHPPPPPPDTFTQRPTPPSTVPQTLPQQSLFAWQMSPFA